MLPELIAYIGDVSSTFNGFVQVWNTVFRLPVTEVQFINKSSLFVLLLNIIRHAGTAADVCK